MHLPTGIARKIYLIITIVITIPLLLFSSLDALKLKDLLVEKRTQKVLEVASILEDKLDNNSFEKILAAKNAAKLTKKEQVQILNQQLQPFVAENKPKLKLYQTDRMQVGYIQNGFTWGGDTSILALNYPIYRDEQLIDHAWANTKIADINRDFYLALLERFLLTFLVWLVCLAIIWQLFKRLETALANLACQIKNEDDQVAAFQEFPKLLPVLNTVVNLRDKLKRENNILRWMLERIPGGFLVLNNQEEFVLANQSAYRLLNNDFLGTNLDHLAKVLNFKNKTDLPLFQVLHQQKTFHKEKFHLNNRVIEFEASPIIDPKTGEQLGAASYFHDITEEEIKNKEMLKLKEKYLIESINLRQLIDAAPLAIVAIDKDKNITAMNTTFLSRYPQFTFKDLIEKPFSIIIDAEGTSQEQSPIIQALQTGKEVHNRVLEFKGRKTSINAYPIKKLDNEEILGAISIGQDITEIEKNKETLEEQAQLLNLSQDYIIVRDMNGKIIFWNTGAEMGYGWRTEEVTGKLYHQLLQPKFSNTKEKIERELVENGYWVGEIVHTRKNGIKVIVESHWTLKKNEFGEPESILEINRDITQLKQNQEQEQQLRNQYRNQVEKLNQLIEICPISIVTLDCEGKIATLNQAFLNLIPAYRKEDLLDQPYRVVTDYLGIDYKKTPVIRALQGEEIRNSHIRVSQKDWLCNALPLRDSLTAQIIGAISIYHDITEHEEMRTELAKLERLNLIGEMAAGVAHEVRNPMTAVRGYLQLIMAKSGREFEKQFKIVLEELDRANSIISDFLSLARDKSSDKKEQNLNNIIMTISPLICGDAMKREVSVKLQLADSLPNLYLNDSEIKQLILNFSRNAIEAMEQKGCLTIKTREFNGQLQLSIQDTGCGIPKEQLAKIFDPFYTTKSNGTGLGLGVCLSIIKRHQGVIEVQSQPGVGTTFTISFNTSKTSSDHLAS